MLLLKMKIWLTCKIVSLGRDGKYAQWREKLLNTRCVWDVGVRGQVRVTRWNTIYIKMFCRGRFEREYNTVFEG